MHLGLVYSFSYSKVLKQGSIEREKKNILGYLNWAYLCGDVALQCALDLGKITFSKENYEFGTEQYTLDPLTQPKD